MLQHGNNMTEASGLYITFFHMGDLRAQWGHKNVMPWFPSSTLCTEN